MDAHARDTYLETQVTTATPQRLRLMLIDAALRRAREAQTAIREGRTDEVSDALSRCREIVGELMAGVRPEAAPLGKQVLSLYAFVLTTLAQVGLTRDLAQLAEVIGVLEEERVTWQQVCQQLPDRPAAQALASASHEEVAPALTTPLTPGFSIDA